MIIFFTAKISKIASFGVAKATFEEEMPAGLINTIEHFLNLYTFSEF